MVEVEGRNCDQIGRAGGALDIQLELKQQSCDELVLCWYVLFDITVLLVSIFDCDVGSTSKPINQNHEWTPDISCKP